MPAIRSLAAAAAVLTLLAAAPALAQSEQEIIGTYRMTVAPQPGSLCPAGETRFEVTRVGGQLIEVSMDRTRIIADWDPARNAFAGTIPFPDPEHPVRLTGAFSRGPDRVNLVVTVSFPPEKPCEAVLSGSIPADAQAADPAATPPAPPLGNRAPSPVGPPIFGVAPNGEPPVYSSPSTPTTGGGLADGKLLTAVGAVLLLLGVVVGFLRGKARAAAPAEPPVAPPPPAPEPEPPAPAPKPKAPRKPKPKPTEAEDELGEG